MAKKTCFEIIFGDNGILGIVGIAVSIMISYWIGKIAKENMRISVDNAEYTKKMAQTAEDNAKYAKEMAESTGMQ